MFIIHAGMHKTGTTSIQRSFARRTPPGVHYLDWRAPNHSDLAVLLFHEAPQDYWVYKREGRSAGEMRDWRAQVAESLARDIAARAGEVHLLSAEWLSVAEAGAIERLRDFVLAHDDQARVVIYLRAAEGYMTSMAQQYIRSGTMEIKYIWPDYRGAVEKFDKTFGQQNVELRVYRPEGAPDWDAVRDFCKATGLPRPKGRPRQANAGMGARHLALLLAHRRELGHGPRTPEEARADRAFREALMTEPSPPFALDPEKLREMVEANAEDLRWIEARLGGVPMSQPRALPPDAVVFRSTEDALAYARDLRAAPAKAPPPAPRKGLFRRLFRRG